MTMHSTYSPVCVDTTRDRLHDLRNLFGVVASGMHLLNDPIADERRNLVLGAIDDAAARGSKILSAMLAGPDSGGACICPMPERIAALAPMLATIVGNAVELRLEVAIPSAFLWCAPERLDRIVIELVANARRALGEGGQISVRTRLASNKLWLIVGDTGAGMTGDCVDRARGRRAGPDPAAHGTGMGQIRAFVRDMAGSLHVRSRPGSGTVIALAVPAIAAAGLR